MLELNVSSSYFYKKAFALFDKSVRGLLKTLVGGPGNLVRHRNLC